MSNGFDFLLYILGCLFLPIVGVAVFFAIDHQSWGIVLDGSIIFALWALAYWINEKEKSLKDSNK